MTERRNKFYYSDQVEAYAKKGIPYIESVIKMALKEEIDLNQVKIVLTKQIIDAMEREGIEKRALKDEPASTT